MFSSETDLLATVLKLRLQALDYRFLTLRRSTIEVHHKLSEARKEASFIPNSKIGLSKNQIASRGLIPWPIYIYTITPFFQRILLASPRFCAKEHRRSEKKFSGNVLPLSENASTRVWYQFRAALDIPPIRYGRIVP